MAFNRILVPLVRSELTAAVFKKALKLAQDNNSKLMLFHSVDWDMGGERKKEWEERKRLLAGIVR